jgi:hypothetical protein
VKSKAGAHLCGILPGLPLVAKSGGRIVPAVAPGRPKSPSATRSHEEVNDMLAKFGSEALRLGRKGGGGGGGCPTWAPAPGAHARLGSRAVSCALGAQEVGGSAGGNGPQRPPFLLERRPRGAPEKLSNAALRNAQCQ